MKIEEKIREVKEERYKFQKRAINSFFHKVPFLIMFLLTFLLTGVTELIKTNFNPAIFKSAEYWFNIILNNASYILIAISSCLMASDTIISRDVTGELSTLTTNLNEMSPSLQNTDVDKFLYETNHARKRTAWLIKIQTKLLKLEMKANEKNTNDYENYKITSEEIYKTKYVKKKIKLLSYLSDAYIEKNIDCLPVKYTKITRKLITNGSSFGKDDDLPNKKSIVMVNGILPKFIFTTAVITILLSFSFDFKSFNWSGLIFVGVKVIGLIANYIYGRDFAPTYVNETTVDMLYIRLHWITLYNEWKKKNAIGKKNELKEVDVV